MEPGTRIRLSFEPTGSAWAELTAIGEAGTMTVRLLREYPGLDPEVGWKVRALKTLWSITAVEGNVLSLSRASE